MRSPSLPLIVLSLGCAGPKAYNQSARVTPVGEIRLQADMVNHTPLGTIANLGDGLIDAVAYLDREGDDLSTYDNSINSAASGAIAYFVDPVVPIGSGFGIRYGVYKRFDIGYSNSMGTNALDAQFQFLGTPGKAARSGVGKNTAMNGSIGLRLSRQSRGLPSYANLDALNDILGFSVSRTDFQAPLTLSIPFGPDEEFGSLSVSAIYSRTNMEIEFSPNDTIVELLSAESDVDNVKSFIEHSAAFNSYGASVTVKGGWRYVFIGAGLGIHYSNYGSFPLFLGESLDLSGLTIVPNLLVEGRY